MKKEITPSLSRRSFLLGSGIAAATFGTGVVLTACSTETGVQADDAGQKNTIEDTSATTEPYTVSGQGTQYGEAAELSSFDIVNEIDTEILICGAGHGGIVASLVAAEAGAKTLVIEKTSAIGTLREYWGVIGSQVQKEAGADIDPNAVANELMRYASYRADQRVINLWTKESGECVDWLMSYLEPSGMSIVAETDIGDGYHGIYPIYPVQMNVQVPGEGEGAGSPDSFKVVPETIVAKAEELGSEFMFSTTLKQCIVEGGRVIGAVAETEDGYIRINTSKGVLIATGGYEGSTDLMQELQPDTCELIASNSSTPQNIGEGLRAGIWAGGVKDKATAFMLFDRGAVAPDEEAGLPAKGSMFWMGSQPWLKVNLDGNRFCNESAPYDFPIHASGLMKGNTWCSIWDSNWISNIESFHTQGCSRIIKSPTQGMTQNFLPEVIEGMNAALLEEGIIVQADTFEELAEKLNIPSDTFAATANRYNKLAVAGSDEDFGKPAKDLIELTPPYFGVRQGAASYCTLDGLRIDADCAVINENNEAISGLWAAGNVSGSFFANNYPELIFGCACGRTMTQARHAILNMLGLK